MQAFTGGGGGRHHPINLRLELVASLADAAPQCSLQQQHLFSLHSHLPPTSDQAFNSASSPANNRKVLLLLCIKADLKFASQLSSTKSFTAPCLVELVQPGGSLPPTCDRRYNMQLGRDEAILKSVHRFASFVHISDELHPYSVDLSTGFLNTQSQVQSNPRDE